MQDEAVNFCKTEMMSFCAACDNKEQKNCRYYEKSQSIDRCMYYILQRYCDCLEAQKAARLAAVQ